MRRVVLLIAVLCFVGASAIVGARTFGSISPPGVNDGTLADFRDAVYVPVKAILNGENPYDTPAHMARHPEVAQDFPLYAPSHLAFFLAFGALSLETARTIHFLLTLGLLLYLAHLSLQAVGRRSWTATFFLGAFLVVSLPGRFILTTGQTTALTVIGVLNAWLWRDKPLVSGAWLALAIFKPVIGLPMAAVFLAARYLKPVLWSLAITLLLSVPILAVCISSAGGAGGFVDSIRRNVDFFSQNPQVRPRSIVRLDMTSFLARVFDVDIPTGVSIAISLVILAATLFVVFRSAAVGRGLDLLAVGITGVLLVGYQPTYHALFVAPIAVWVAMAPATLFTRRWLVAGLLAFVVVNPFASVAFSNRFQHGGDRFIGLLGAPLCCACIAASFLLLAADQLGATRATSVGGDAAAVAAPQPAATSTP